MGRVGVRSGRSLQPLKEPMPKCHKLHIVLVSDTGHAPGIRCRSGTVVDVFLHRHHLALALLLAACVTGVSWHWGARSVGGADSSGYVSQAEAWLTGDLYVREPYIEAHHPPFSRWALAPPGWRPEVDGYAIVPPYSPGYPLMPAGAKRLAGPGAPFGGALEGPGFG